MQDLVSSHRPTTGTAVKVWTRVWGRRREVASPAKPSESPAGAIKDYSVTGNTPIHGQ